MKIINFIMVIFSMSIKDSNQEKKERYVSKILVDICFDKEITKIFYFIIVEHKVKFKFSII